MSGVGDGEMWEWPAPDPAKVDLLRQAPGTVSHVHAAESPPVLGIPFPLAKPRQE